MCAISVDAVDNGIRRQHRQKTNVACMTCQQNAMAVIANTNG